MSSFNRVSIDLSLLFCFNMSVIWAACYNSRCRAALCLKMLGRVGSDTCSFLLNNIGRRVGNCFRCCRFGVGIEAMLTCLGSDLGEGSLLFFLVQ